jgi:hypothetical protein
MRTAPSRLACRARTVWQCQSVPSLSRLLPPGHASPRSGCLQLQRPAATGQRWVLSSHPVRRRLVAHDAVDPDIHVVPVRQVARHEDPVLVLPGRGESGDHRSRQPSCRTEEPLEGGSEVACRESVQVQKRQDLGDLRGPATPGRDDDGAELVRLGTAPKIPLCCPLPKIPPWMRRSVVRVPA